MSEEATLENGVKSNTKLDTEVANGIKHAVSTLDESSSGTVSKSQLQAVVANVCQAIKTAFVSEDLENYLPEKDDLSVSEFLEFLESKLLVKGKKLNSKEMDELSWVVVGQKYDENPHMLTKKDAFKLWLVFKKLDVSGELRVDVEEVCIILEKFVRGIGVQWDEQHLVEFTEDDALTYWKFVECLEQKFLVGVDKSVLREGLQELYGHILDEVTRTGFLSKKGHSMIKSQKSRWFALTPDKLSYYVSSGYREKKGEVILNNEAKVTSIPDKGSNKYRFQVMCGSTKKDYEQTAPDQRTKQAWMTDIQTAIDCYGGQTPLKRDLFARKAKRDEDRARKAEEERKRREQEDLLDQQRKEIDLLKKRKEEIERHADEEKAMLDAEIKRREELEEIQRNLQQLLEDQKRAREEDEKIRAAKERLLEEERIKREQLEALRLQQQQELLNEKMQKEELMEKQKEQERIMEEERKRLQHLEEERIKAEEAARVAKEKLDAAETAAKNATEQAKDRVRQLKTSIGLKGTVGPKVDPLVSHRGKGAFTLEEFLNRATEWSGLAPGDEERPKAALTAPEVDELVKASATPASNQNIPEFLKKAAAWSGLNPETYLQTQEEKKNSPPPKVAAKPPKPLPTSVVNEPSAGAAVSQEDEKVPQEGGEGSQEGGEGPEVAEKKEDEGKVEEKVEDGEGPQVTDEVSVGESVSNDGYQVSDVVKDGVDEKEEGVDEGSEVTPVNKEGSQVETVDNEELKVEKVDDKVVDNTDGSVVAVVDNEKSDALLDDVGGKAQTDEGVDGELNVEKGECQEEKSSEESKSECEGEALGGDEDGSVRDEAADNENSPKEVEGGDSKQAVVSDENSSEVEQTEKPEILPEVANSESNEAGDRSGEDESGDKSENGDAGDQSGDEQAQPSDTFSEVNNEETDVNNGESKVNNAKQEVDGKEPEVNNEENKPTNECSEMKEESGAVDESKEEDKNGNLEPAEGKDVPGDKNNIVENGQSVEEIESPAENEHLNDGDTKSVLPEKCGKPVENSSTQNMETVNS